MSTLTLPIGATDLVSKPARSSAARCRNSKAGNFGRGKRAREEGKDGISPTVHSLAASHPSIAGGIVTSQCSGKLKEQHSSSFSNRSCNYYTLRRLWKHFQFHSLPTLLGVQFQIWGSEARGDATERKEKLVLQQCDHRLQGRAAHSGHRRAAVHMALRTVHSLAQSQFSKTCAVSVSQSKSGFEGG